MAKIRKGKTRTILESSIDSALLAVEVFNKPRTSFRNEAFIALMVIAWTRLFHAHFNATIGDKFYHKKKNGRYELVDGERKSWELATCIKKYGKLSRPIEKNLQFFIRLRNKIEHRHIDKREVDVLIFGECQALLYNYENLVIELFGRRFALNESLVYSLQFSQLRTRSQNKASKSALSKDLSDIVGFVENYRNSLSEDEFNSQEYSIKLIQIPKISNTNRADAAIEFVRWDTLSDKDKAAYEQITVIVKDKKVKVEGANVRRLKPSEVVAQINNKFNGFEVTMNLHVVLYKLFRIRPEYGSDDPFETNTKYCLYDEPHGDYVYQPEWVDFVVNYLQSTGAQPTELRSKLKKSEFFDISDFES
ncbi:MAG: DUF3644 domain-containing protein [Candidatus Paceibacterota bacterium]